MKLISMTDFVLEQGIKTEVQSITDQWSSRVSRYNKIMSYAKFLKQPLELWMFVPCDKDGNVLEEPTHYGKSIETMRELLKEYQEAKEICLFECFEIRKMEGWSILDFPNNKFSKDFAVFDNAFKNLTIEDLVIYNLQLTQTAIKQLGL